MKAFILYQCCSTSDEKSSVTQMLPKKLPYTSQLLEGSAQKRILQRVGVCIRLRRVRKAIYSNLCQKNKIHRLYVYHQPGGPCVVRCSLWQNGKYTAFLADILNWLLTVDKAFLNTLNLINIFLSCAKHCTFLVI